MTLVETFHAALSSLAVNLPRPELLPERLARACAQVLPVDGAGISHFFTADRRLPLGASDPVSAEAERLQFTAGEGPCLSAHAEGTPIVAGESTIEARWPAFPGTLVTHTPIRGTILLPLRHGLQGIGAVDLYVVPPNDVASLSVQDALAITEEIAVVLQAQSLHDRQHSDGPAWLDAPAAQQRSTVW
ncbi:conserved protein of unknown function; putative GAF domain [Modestobacter italicus]|uniref:GAF domain-containing protein n=1 Tax=Modestobacter italicus (strain DSM 44449 / CECT 9708 / BC 501) TaxID=2732864 RepID=I4EYP3_MODI5|nr:GAF domain-containing protein [Modestobacter marinus]CCH88506.1 conserved protein of unknown function; putative GAF domain [Modestobacter marinus]